MASDASAQDDGDDEPSALEDAFVRYQENGLRLPPVPRELASELDEFADWHWGSEDLSLEDRDGFVDTARQPGGPVEIAFGHTGHGVNSWWLCCRLQTDALAVFVRLAYGGVYEDAAATLTALNDVAAELESLIPAADAAKRAGRLRGGHRLIVVADQMRRGFWEVAGGADGAQNSRDPLGDALAFLSTPVLNEPPPEE